MDDHSALSGQSDVRGGSKDLSVGRVPALDGLRGLAILLVLFCHLWCFPASSSLIVSFLEKLATCGLWGVDLFFVLSGFFITGILIDSRRVPHYFRNFYARRTLRIAPLYAGTLLFIFGFLPLVLTMNDDFRFLCRHQLWLWLYLENIYGCLTGSLHPCGMAHFWSLGVEEQYYLFWPVCVLVCNPRRLMHVAVGLLLVAWLTRLGVYFLGLNPGIAVIFPVSRLDGFAAGALVLLCSRSPRGREWLARSVRPVAVVSLILLGTLKVLHIQHSSLWLASEHGFYAVSPGLTAVFFASLLAAVILSAPQSRLQRVFSLSPLRWLGRYSYGIYVFHFPLLYLLPHSYNWLVRRMVKLFGWKFTIIVASSELFVPLLTLGLTLVTAWLSWHLFENPFLKLKRYFPQDGPLPETTSQDAIFLRKSA
jgi:peptidoglycan/LPS O-acetylase OafA/YrhL